MPEFLVEKTGGHRAYPDLTQAFNTYRPRTPHCGHTVWGKMFQHQHRPTPGPVIYLFIYVGFLIRDPQHHPNTIGFNTEMVIHDLDNFGAPGPPF